MKSAAWGAIMVLALFGCQSAKPTYLVAAPDATPDQSWTKHEGEGYSFYVPSDWKVPSALDGMDGMSDPSTIQNLSNPAVGAGLAPPKQSATAGAQIRLVNPSYRPIPGETGTQIFFTKETLGGDTNLSAEAGKAAGALPRAEKAEITLPCGPAVEITSSVKTKSGDSSHQIMIVMVDGKDVFRLHLMTANDVSVIKDIARPIAETFRVSQPGP